MKKKIVFIYLLVVFISLSLSHIIKSEEIKYQEGMKVLSQEMAEQMIKENNGELVQMADDKAPDGYPYFVGYNNATHKAMYADKQEMIPRLFSIKITNIKNVGTWRYGGYWGMMMSDQNNNPVYCGDYGKNEPIGSSNWKSQESVKVKRALSWAYPNVASSTSKNNNYARSQLAIWTAQKSLKINSTTLGPYQKVVDAYSNKIKANEKTFTRSSYGSAGILNKLNMSKAISLSGNAKYKFSKNTITNINKNKVALYVYQKSTKKYIKVAADKWYLPSQYKYLRLGTSDLSKSIILNNIKMTTDLKPISGYIYDNGKSGDQRIFMSVQEPIKSYEITLKLEKQTGRISASKQLNKYAQYTYTNGVVFGIYNSEKDAKADTNRVTTMTTNSAGLATSKELNVKTYYVKELKGKTNYKMSSVIAKVIVKKNSTTKADGSPNNNSVTSFRNTYELGKIIGYKSIDGLDLYEQIIKDQDGNSIFLSENNNQVVFVDEDYSLQVARYPSKKEMIENDLFNKPIVLKIPKYDYVYEQVIKLDENNKPIPLLDDNNEIVLDENNEVVYQKEDVIKRDANNNAYVQLIRDEQGNILFKDKTLKLNYPSQKKMDNIERINEIEFALYDKKGILISKSVSQKIVDENGMIFFENLKPGNYFIKESKTRDDLILSKREYQVEVKANQQSLINAGKDIINIPKAGRLEINKTNILKEKLSGVVFAIYESDENGNMNKAKLIDLVTTNNQGKAFFNYYAGEYYLKELVAHPKHSLNQKELKFTLVNDKLTELNLKNEIILKQRKILKQDFATKKTIAGARLCLKTQNNKNFYLKTNNKTMKVKEHCWISQKDSYKVLLEPQSYHLKEEKAPRGYLKSKDMIKFMVAENSKQVKQIKIINKKIYSDVKVSKVDVTNEKELAGAKMCLMEKNNKEFKINVDNKKKHVKKYCWTSTNEAKKMRLYYGKYLIEEVISPKGYLKIKTMIPVTIDKTGIKQVKVKNEAINKDLVQSGYNLNLVVFLLLTSLGAIIVYFLFNRRTNNN